MHGLVSTLATLLPLAAAAPLAGLGARDSNPGCQAGSTKEFNWTVDNFDYHASYVFSTPAHQNSWGYVNFNLTNSALTYTVACSAASDQLSDFFYGTMPYTCKGPDNSTTTTTFDFSRPSGQLDVNQTWTCSDTDPQYPSTFHAYGTANLTLNCTETDYQNPSWEIGQIYSDRTVTCGLVTVPLKPYLMTAVA